MESLALALILSSAVAHAAWNYSAKGTTDKDSYLLLMNLTSQLTLLPAMVLLIQDWSLPSELIPILVLSAIAEAAYYIALGRAYDVGDLSIVYPIARSSPIFLVIAGVAMFGESISLVGLLSIFTIIAGVWVINMSSLNIVGLRASLASFKQPALFFALIAALATTTYTLCDKLGVSIADPFRYNFWLGIFVVGALAPVVVLKSGFKNIGVEWSRSSIKVTVFGVLMRGGYILVLLAMRMAPVSYLLSMRQVSVVIGALLGVRSLGESHGNMRIIGSVVVFVGVYILAAFA